MRATSSDMEGLTSSRWNASRPALVVINASSTRARIAVSVGNDSASSATGRPLAGGGRFASDGGTMISTASLYVCRTAATPGGPGRGHQVETQLQSDEIGTAWSRSPRE